MRWEREEVSSCGEGEEEANEVVGSVWSCGSVVVEKRMEARRPRGQLVCRALFVFEATLSAEVPHFFEARLAS